MCARQLRGFLWAFDAGGDRRPARCGVEEGQLVRPVAEHRHAEGLEHLGGRRHVEQGLRAGADDERLRTRQLSEVGGDVGPLREASVDAADPTRAEEADPGERAGPERAAHRRRAELASSRAGREIARPRLAGFRSRLAEALDLPLVQADDDRAVDHADGRGHGSFDGDRRLRGEPHLHPHPGWETVCDQRSLERDHRAALVESLLHFRGDLEQFGHTGTAPS